MKKMWLVAPVKLELTYLSALDFESSVSTISTMGRYIFHGIAHHRGRGLLAIIYPLCNSLDYQSSQFFISKRVKHYGISLIYFQILLLVFSCTDQWKELEVLFISELSLLYHTFYCVSILFLKFFF